MDTPQGNATSGFLASLAKGLPPLMDMVGPMLQSRLGGNGSANGVREESAVEEKPEPAHA